MKSALIVIDVQNFFADVIEHAVTKIMGLDCLFKMYSHPVIYTQHGHTQEELTHPFTNQLVKKWGAEGSIARGSPDWEIVPNLQICTKDCAIVQKSTYDAFIGTELEDLLEERGVKRVVVVGCMTDCCVDTTARGAFNRGFETWIVENACGSANQTQHEAGLKAFGFAFGKVLSFSDAARILEKEWKGEISGPSS